MKKIKPYFLRKIKLKCRLLQFLFGTFRPDFTSKLVYVLAFGTPKFYIAPYDKIKHELVNLSSDCDVKSGLRVKVSYERLEELVISLASLELVL